MKLFSIVFACLLAISLTGCISGARSNGGHVSYVSPVGAHISMVQSQDPKDKSVTSTTHESTTEYALPAGSKLVLNSNEVTLASTMPVKVTEKDAMNTGLGAAQKNVLGETIAKLQALSWMTYLGAAIALFGVASLFYPPLKLIVASSTTSLALIGSGIAMIVLPTLLVGHEVLILTVALGAAGLWWLAHSHGSITGELTALKNQLFTVTPVQPAPAPAPSVPTPAPSVPAPTPVAPVTPKQS